MEACNQKEKKKTMQSHFNYVYYLCFFFSFWLQVSVYICIALQVYFTKYVVGIVIALV